MTPAEVMSGAAGGCLFYFVYCVFWIIATVTIKGLFYKDDES